MPGAYGAIAGASCATQTAPAGAGIGTASGTAAPTSATGLRQARHPFTDHRTDASRAGGPRQRIAQAADRRPHARLPAHAARQKKSGGTKETLDIIITDEQGAARPYETFSGGEAFRVDFALRLALAQLLAERSGVRVRTLVIDEGFGTQDPQGLQHLVEAIQAVQSDFDKILVITHLSELKQAFPVRIEVEKDPVEARASR